MSAVKTILVGSGRPIDIISGNVPLPLSAPAEQARMPFSQPGAFGSQVAGRLLLTSRGLMQRVRIMHTESIERPASTPVTMHWLP